MPLIMIPPYRKAKILSQISTKFLMHLNGLKNGQLVEEVQGLNVPSPYSPSKIGVSAVQASSGTKSLSSAGFAEALVSTSNAAFTFAGDFTLELFFWPNTLQSSYLMNIGGIDGANWGSQSIAFNLDGTMNFRATGTNTGNSIGNVNVTPYLLGQWNHCAIVRQGNLYTFFLNGKNMFAATYAGAPNTPTTTTIGNYPTGTASNFKTTWTGFDGFIDNLRITKGVARYSGATYVLPTVPYAQTVAGDPSWNSVTTLLDMETVNANGVPLDVKGAAVFTFVKEASQTLAFAGQGPFQQGVEGTCMYLTSSNGYLSAQTNFAPGTDDFTAEIWTYSTVTAATYKTIFGNRKYALDTKTGFSVGVNGTGLYVYADGFLIQGGTYAINKFNHIAFVRKAGVMTLYLNGVAVGSYSAKVYNFTETQFGIGCNQNGSERLVDGGGEYLNDFRISAGARYSANFTPPTAMYVVD